MPETWLEALAEQRELLIAQYAHEDEVADGLQSEPREPAAGEIVPDIEYYDVATGQLVLVYFKTREDA